ALRDAKPDRVDHGDARALDGGLPRRGCLRRRDSRVRRLVLLITVAHHFAPPLGDETTSFSLKIGRNIAMTMPPTITPRNTINIGSISDVSASNIASISSSQKSAIFSSMVSILPVASPAETIRSIIGGKIGFFESATE